MTTLRANNRLTVALLGFSIVLLAVGYAKSRPTPSADAQHTAGVVVGEGK